MIYRKHDIVIVNADKGRAVIIINVTDYIEKVERQVTTSITTNYLTIKLQKTTKQSIML